MNTNDTVYTFGDGFAAGHIWPEWPQILQAILYNYQVVNISGIGAGNEFIFTNLLSSLQQSPNATFIVQWAMPNRFDKLIEDASWDQIINADPNYSDNQITSYERNWWLSSASTSHCVQEYHRLYVQHEQSRLRSFNYIWSSGNLLKNNQYCFFGTYDFNYLTDKQKQLCQDFTWAWFMPWFGLQRYAISTQFDELRQPEVQPSPIIHLEWVKNFVLPKLNLDIDSVWLDTITERIYNQAWIPHNPNQTQIWNSINEQRRT